MSKLRMFSKNLVILVLLLTFYSCSSCSKQKVVKDILSNVENIVEQQPDSALRLLNTVLFPEDLNKSLYNKYNLLLLRAKDKSYKDIISDTVIFAVRDYYIQKKDYPNAAMAAFYCGRIWHEQKNTDKAIEAYIEAEKWADKTNNYNLKGLIQANWGILHMEHSSYKKAIELSKNAVEMYDKAKNYKNEIGALRLIGNCFVLSAKIDSAFSYYKESLKLATLYNMPGLQSDIKESMGVAYREQGLYEQAKKLFNEALAFPEDSVKQAGILLNIAQIYVLENKTDSVKFYLDEALVLQISNPWLMRSSYFLMSKMEEEEKNYPEALRYYKKYYDYSTRAFDSEKNNKLLELQEKYDFEKLKDSQDQLIIKHQNALIILSLVLLAACIITLAYYRKSAQNKKLLSESKQRIEILQRMADNFSIEKSSFRHALLEQFNVLRKTALINSMLNENERASGQKLLKKFNQIVYGQDALEWNKLYQSMDSLKNGFYSKVRRKYPQLNETEFRICCLTCETDFNDKEIGIILGTTFYMVRRIRSDLRKKIGIPKGEDFSVFFENAIQ